MLTQIRVRVGEYDFSSTLEPYPHIERGAKKKVVHPHYNFFTYENDLALVQLDEPIDFQPHVGPICLPPENIDLLGKNATVTGWGRLSEGQLQIFFIILLISHSINDKLIDTNLIKYYLCNVLAIDSLKIRLSRIEPKSNQNNQSKKTPKLGYNSNQLSKRLSGFSVLPNN